LNKKVLIPVFLLFFFLIFPVSTSAEDNLQSVSVEPLKEDTVYIYTLDSCTHCHEALGFLEELKKEHKINYINKEISEVKNRVEWEYRLYQAGQQRKAVPFIIINEESWLGVDKKKKEEIKNYLLKEVKPEENLKKTVGIPLVGEVSLGVLPTYLATAIIGIIDGFNPCSLWVLTLLLSFMTYSKSRKKMLVVGVSFLLTTAIIYGLFIMGVFQGISYIQKIPYMKTGLGIFIMLFALISIKDYYYFGEGLSFIIPQKNKKKIADKLRGVINLDKSNIFLVIASSSAALTATVIELPCTSGFPVIWSNLLSKAGIEGALMLAHLMIYIALYLIDELVIFAVVLKTLKISKITKEKGKKLKLFSGLIMFYLGISLLFPLDLISLISVRGVFNIVFFSIISYFILGWSNKKENKNSG
jgi:glutaredoxin